MSQLKMLLHVSEADRWPAALGNLVNITKHEPQPRVRVVVNGSAVYPLLGSCDLSEQMVKATSYGVQFQVCRNALTAHHISPEQLPAWAELVPSGVVACAAAQADGYAYIKP